MRGFAWLAVLLFGASFIAVDGANDEASKENDISPVDEDAKESDPEVNEEKSEVEDPGNLNEDDMELDDNAEKDLDDNAEEDAVNPRKEKDPSWFRRRRCPNTRWKCIRRRCGCRRRTYYYTCPKGWKTGICRRRRRGFTWSGK